MAWMSRLGGAMLLGTALAGPVAAQGSGASVVFAAASLTDAMGDISRLWQAHGNPPPVMSFGASSTLARQIENGAPAGLFASADERWMDELAKNNLVIEGTRRDVLANQLVLVEPKASAKPVSIGPGFDLLSILGPNGRLAVGDPKGVPAGIYAEQALRRLGLWDKVEPRLARSDNVRSALLLVERGEAPAGIVYATDAAVAPGVVIAGVFPADSHDPVTYPFALLKGGDTPQNRALLSFIESPEGIAAFKARGFSTP